MKIPKQVTNLNPDTASQWGFILSSTVSNYLALRCGVNLVSPAETYIRRLGEMVKMVLPLNAAGVPDLSGFAPSEVAANTYHSATETASRLSYKYSPEAIISRQLNRLGIPIPKVKK